MRLIWKLLRQHISLLQLTGFFVTNLVGMVIVLTALQVYRDVTPLVNAPDSFLDNDFMVLSKQVEQVGVNKTFFTEEELTDLEEQPFVEAMGEVTPAQYRVTGGLSAFGIRMSTYLFFESVPDRFLDVESDQWQFEEGDDVIPIILPRNYLNLYNFGFASTQGLPQLSEELVREIPLSIELSGRGRIQNFQGRVVAFSNRLNTILVPDSFIRWSNDCFSDKPVAGPSRIIIEVPNVADEQLQQYLTEHEYRVEGDGNDQGQMNYFLRLITFSVTGVGLLITLLSFFILMLSIFLLLQKNTRKLEDLLMVGYTPAQVACPYQLLSLGLNLGAFLCAIPVVLWVRSRYLSLVGLFGEDYEASGVGITLLIGLLFVGFVTSINALAIRHKVVGLWLHE